MTGERREEMIEGRKGGEVGVDETGCAVLKVLEAKRCLSLWLKSSLV